MTFTFTPNWLTIIRIFLIPSGVWAIFHDSSDRWQIIAFSIYFILAMTDVVDGRWARKSGKVSALGAFLDPVADKVLIGSAMISLAILDRFSWWIFAIIAVRELGITAFRLLVIRDGVIPASKGGKIKTLMQNIGIGLYILPLPDVLEPLRITVIGLAVLLTVVTGVDYIVQWYRAKK